MLFVSVEELVLAGEVVVVSSAGCAGAGLLGIVVAVRAKLTARRALGCWNLETRVVPLRRQDLG